VPHYQVVNIISAIHGQFKVVAKSVQRHRHRLDDIAVGFRTIEAECAATDFRAVAVVDGLRPAPAY